MEMWKRWIPMLAVATGCGVAVDDSSVVDGGSSSMTDASTSGASSGEPGESAGAAASTTGATSASATGPSSTGAGSGVTTGEGSASSTESGDGPMEIPADPRMPGPHPTARSQASLETGGGNVPLEVFVPVGTDPRAIVLLTHGFQLTSANYLSYGEHLASWGVATVLPTLPGSILDAPTHVSQRDRLIAISDWIEAEQGGAGPLATVPPDALIAAGHSMGGKLSFLAATLDPRVQGVFGIDPVDSAGGPGAQPSPENPSVAPELMPLVLVPVALLGETTNATGGLGGACAPSEENFAQYFDGAVSPALEVEVVGANHMSFLDDPNCGLSCTVCPTGVDDPAATLALSRGYLTAFALYAGAGDVGYRHWLAGRGAAADVASGDTLLRTANDF